MRPNVAPVVVFLDQKYNLLLGSYRSHPGTIVAFESHERAPTKSIPCRYVSYSRYDGSVLLQYQRRPALAQAKREPQHGYMGASYH